MELTVLWDVIFFLILFYCLAVLGLLAARAFLQLWRVGAIYSSCGAPASCCIGFSLELKALWWLSFRSCSLWSQ